MNDLPLAESSRSNMRSSRKVVFLSGCLLGFLVWALSPWLVGKSEPWDADWPFYMLVMLFGGGLFGLAWPRHVFLAYVSVWLGQCGALLLPTYDRAWFLLGIVTTAIGGLLLLPGAAIGAIGKKAWLAIRNSSQPDT